MQDPIAQQFDYFCTLALTAEPALQGWPGERHRSAGAQPSAGAAEPGARNIYYGLDFAASTWFGFFLPRGTPAPIVKKLRDATAEAINTPSVQEQFEWLPASSNGKPPDHQSTEYLQGIIGPEIEKNGAPLKAAGMSIE